MTPCVLSVGSGDRSLASGRPRGAGNRLLDLLPGDEYARIRANVEPVAFGADAVICEYRECARYAYFPQGCAISMQCITRDGASVEFALVGCEGLLGVETLLESDRMHGRAVVIRPGRALRLPVRELMHAFHRAGPFRSGLLDFYGAFSTQVVQRSICHRVHTIEQQLCTWLLLMHDRSSGLPLPVTHELIGGLLGARREGVTIALRRLRSEGLLRTSYRRLAIVDRAALEARSCECYDVIRRAYARSA